MKAAALGLAVILANYLLLPLMTPVFEDIMVFAGVNVILAVSLNLVNGFTGQFSIGHAGFMAVGGYTAAFLSMFARDHGWNLADPVQGQLLLAGCLVAAGIFSAVIG